MDPVTHTLIGANLAHAFFKKRVGREAVPVLCWASNLPDLDVAVLLLNDPLSVTLRRTFGHSAFTAPLLVAGAAWLITRIYKGLRYKDALVMCAVGAGVHVFFDLVNSFGVRLTWPVTPWRPELAIIFIIDLILAGILALGAFAPKVDRTKAARAALCAAAVYVNVCELSRMQAMRLLKNFGQEADMVYAFPEPLGPHRWRGVVQRDDAWSVYLVEPWAKRVTGKGTLKTDLRTEEVMKARYTPEGRRLEAFFKAPVWMKDGPGKVRVYDLRFRTLLFPRESSFEYRFEEGKLAS